MKLSEDTSNEKRKLHSIENEISATWEKQRVKNKLHEVPDPPPARANHVCITPLHCNATTR